MFAFACPFLGIFGKENNLSGGCAWGSGQAFGDFFGFGKSFMREYRVQQLVQFVGFHAQEGGLFIYHAFAHHIHGDLHHGKSGAFATAGLQHPQLSFLDGKLQVLHVFTMLFQFFLGCKKLLISLGHGFFQGGIFCGTFLFGNSCQFCPTLGAYLGDLQRGADACHHVFTLSVKEEFAIEEVFSGGGVTGESHAGGAGIAHIAKHHCLHVHGCSPFGRDVVQLTVEYGTVVIPAVKHGKY